MVMAEINDGGPAYPTKRAALDPRESGFFTEDGMTLRDYFAAKSMEGMLTRPGSINVDDDARFAYRMADAMLRARSAP